MPAFLKGFMSFEAPENDVHKFNPEDPTCFALDFLAYIGSSEHGKGSDEFRFTVCTQGWLAENLPDDARWPHQNDQVIFPRGLLIVPHWDLEVVLQSIRALCEQVVGDDWVTICRQLNRYSVWEYEYRDDRGDL